MASIIWERNGTCRMEFTLGDERKRVRLEGKPGKGAATEFKGHLENLITAYKNAVSPAPKTQAWIADLSEEMHGRIAKHGLLTPHQDQDQQEAATLGKLIDEITKLADVKPNTLITYAMSRRFLVEFFGEDKPLADIGPKEAEQFRASLKTEKKLAEATIAKRIKHGRQWFKRAIDWGLVSRNPFAGVKIGSMANSDREHFIDRATADKVMAACPNLEWKLIFALSRYGGLRCPSEHLALRREDVDFEHGRLWVRSSKTEGHEGGEGRHVPIFPELRDLLAERFKDTLAGSELAIAGHGDKVHGSLTSCNLRTQFQRILKAAGVKAWPRLFHNLRATRQTELCERFPVHVVCDWLGNSPTIAKSHYLQTTDAHFALALAPVRVVLQGENAAHQQVTNDAKTCQEENTPDENTTKTPENPQNQDTARIQRYSRRESNNPQNAMEKPQTALLSGENAAHFPADLAQVVAAWPTLPEATRAAIVALTK